MSLFAAYLPAVLSFWLLGAHALRGGDAGLAAAWVIAPLLLVLRHGWTRRAAQFALGAGIFLWADVGGKLVQVRVGLGQPWTRLTVIIGAVMLLAVLAVALLEHPSVEKRHKDAAPHWPPALAFLLTAMLLAVSRAKVSFPILMPDRFLPGSGWLLVLALSAYAAFVVRALLSPHSTPRQWSRRRVRLWSLFSFVFFGQLLLGLAGAERFLMTGALHLPVPALIVAGPLYRGEGFFMPVLFLSTVALVGPAWCSWLCYVGAWDGLASRAKNRPAPLPRWRHAVRAGIAALVFATAWGLRAMGTPMSVAVALAAAFGIVGVVVMLTLSRRTGAMVHCTAFCPIGLVGNLLGRLNPFRVRIGQGCTGCGVCARACRYDALDDDRIRQGRPGLSCTLCGDCVSSCPHSAMGYRLPLISSSTARAAFVVLAVSAHAVFLGVARI